MNTMSYSRFLMMAAISFAMMYIVMFLNVEDASHVFLSMNRTYMALLMVAPMQVLMIVMMGKMYRDKKKNRIILLLGVAIFLLAFAGLRSQTFVSDREYMKGMIPHHSSAIMTSRNASIHDPRVRQLSEQIITSQEREIAEMKQLLKELD